MKKFILNKNKYMLKVCSIDEDGRFGGPQKRILLVAESLNKKGILTKVILPNQETRLFEKKLKEKKILFKKVKLTRLSSNFLDLFKYILLFIPQIYLLYRIISKEKFDLIQCNSSTNFKGLIVASILKKKVIWVLEETHLPFFLKYLVRLNIFLFNPYIIYTSKKVKKFFFDNNFYKKSYYIPAPISLQEFTKNKNNKSNGKKIVIGTMVSSIVPVKGIELFIQIANYFKNYKNIRFVLVGAKTNSQIKYYKKIKSIIKNSNFNKNFFIFKNFYNKPIFFYKEIDIFLCTSLSEGGPLTLYEAMAMNKSVISFNVGAAKEYIKNNINGFIIDNYDLKAFIQKIKFFILNQEKISSFGKRNRLIISRCVDKEIISMKYKKLIYKAINE